MKRFLSVLMVITFLFAVGAPTAMAHDSKAVKKDHAQCTTLKVKKKIGACKACITKYKGKRHYHPHAKPGNRCHE